MEQRLRAALTTALKARDQVAVAALRSALSALANATAVAVPPPAAGGEHFAGSAVGVGAAEAPRREVTAADAAGILRAEIAERLAAAEHYPPAAATRLRAEAAVLAGFLDPPVG